MGQHTETARVFDLMTDLVVSKSGFCHDQSLLSVLQATYRLCVVIKTPELYGWKSLENGQQNSSVFLCRLEYYEHIDLNLQVCCFSTVLPG